MKEYTVKVKEDKSELFEELIQSLDFAEVDNTDWWKNLSENSKDIIQKGKKELEEGFKISNADVRKKMDDVLGKS